MESLPWRKRIQGEKAPDSVECLIDWQPTPAQPEAPANAEIWYDVPLTFEPPSHAPRFVLLEVLQSGLTDRSPLTLNTCRREAPGPLRPRANYTNTEFRKTRAKRLENDYGLCVFCKSPASTVQHITYRHAGGNETLEELRSLCRLCHDAVTMIEYGLGMGLNRINPEDTRWREQIAQKRAEIIQFRSLETRYRHLEPEEVE